MFDPAKAMEQPLFLMRDTDAQSMLNLPSGPENLYSFAEITKALGTHQKLVQSLLQLPTQDLSTAQRAVLELYENAGLFTQIMLSCTSFLRLSIDLPERESQQLGLIVSIPNPPRSSIIIDTCRKYKKQCAPSLPTRVQTRIVTRRRKRSWLRRRVSSP